MTSKPRYVPRIGSGEAKRVTFEILGADQATTALHLLDDSFAKFAVVQVIRTLFGQRREACRQVGIGKSLADTRHAAVREEHASRFGNLPNTPRGRRKSCATAATRKAVCGHGDRGCKDLGKRKSARLGVECQPALDRAGHARRTMASRVRIIDDLARVGHLEHVLGRPAGPSVRLSIAETSAVSPAVEDVTAASGDTHLWLDDRTRRNRRDGCVGDGAAIGQHR